MNGSTATSTRNARRPSRWPSARSKNSSARDRSCGSAARTPSRRSRRSPPDRSASTGRSASAACRAAASIEIFGPESSGKTTLALQTIAQAQKLGGVAAFIDAEHALDAQYAQKLGVDLDNLLVSQPDNGEQALEITEVLIRSNGVDVVVVDSVAALVPRAEIEGEMGEAQMGLQARLMSQALRKLTGVVSKSKTCLIFINQLREKIGVMFGNPETTTGGRALKFYSSVRVDIRRIGAIKDGDTMVGGRTRVKIVKNKVAPPFREAEFDMMYGEGISREGDLLDQGVERNIVEKSGTWFSYGGERLGQGRENAKAFLKQNTEMAAEIEAEAAQGDGTAGVSKSEAQRGSQAQRLSAEVRLKGSARRSGSKAQGPKARRPDHDPVSDFGLFALALAPFLDPYFGLWPMACGFSSPA